MSKIKIVNLANYLVPAALLWIGFILVCFAVFINKNIGDRHLATGINQQINYQGRLLTDTGAVVPDGSYNIEFKIYQDGDGVLGGGDETLEWTEPRTGGNRVLVKNGYFSVYLGSITSFGSNVDWNQDTLWLSVNIGGTGAPSWDGEMSPFTRFSSTPYALNSKALNGLESSNFVQLAQGAQTDASTTNASISINKTGGTANILDLMRAGTSVLSIANNGSAIFKNQTDSTTAFQVQNLAGTQLFGVDTTNNLISIAGASNPALRSWSSTTGLGVDKSEGGFVTANGYIYAVGSGGGATPSAGVYYSKINADGTIGTWNPTSSLNNPRWGNKAVVGNGYIYVIGGNDGSAMDSVEYAKINADGSLGAWAATSGMGTARYRSGAIAVNGYIYAIGNPGSNSVEYAKINGDGTLGAWSSTSSLLGSRYGHATISANGRIYVMGGNNGSDLATVETAVINSDGTLGAWASNTSMGTAQNIVSAVVANGYVYTVGGCSGVGCPSNQVQYAAIGSNGTLGAWGTTSSLGTARYGNGAVVANGYIYAIGGAGLTTVEYTSIERVQIGAALDLVGLSGGNLADGQTGVGGELTAGNTNIIGGLQVQGQANLAAGLNIGSDLVVGGSTISGAADLTLRSGGVTALSLLGEGGVYIDASALGQTYIGTAGTLQDVTVGNQGTSSATRLWAGTSGVTVQTGANTATAFQVKNTGNVTVFGIDTSSSKVLSALVDGASAVGFTLNTSNTYSTSGAKLLSIQNNGAERMSVDKDGNLTLANGAVFGTGSTSGLTTSCSGSQFLRGQVATGGLTTSGTCAAVTGTEITDGSIANVDLANSSISFGLGTSGTDINWSSSSVSLGGALTLNLPDASATNRGLVTTGAQTFAGSKTFNDTINLPGGGSISLFNCCGNATWINMPTTGASGIGSGGAGANPWIAYVAGGGQWFSNSAAGDLAYRNTGGNILFGNTAGNYQVSIGSSATTFNTNIDSNNNLDINTITGGGLSDCDSSSSKLLWNSATSQFSCGTDRASAQVRKSANEAVTSSVALQDDNELLISAGSNETWIFQVNYTYTTGSSGTPDIRVGMNAPAGSNCAYGTANTSETGGDLAGGATACDTAIIVPTTATGTKAGILTGSITTNGTPGNLVFRWAQGTSSGTSTTVVAGSSIIGYKVTGADYAETYYSKDFSVEPGMIVQLEGTGPSQVLKANKPYSDRQVGIVSTNPGQVLSEADGNGKLLPVALSGRVPIKLSTENGLPKAGEMITASATRPGYGMRASDSGYAVGQLLVDAKDNGDGTAEGFVYVRHGYWQAPIKLDMDSIFSAEGISLNNQANTSTDNLLVTNEYAGLTQSAIDQIIKGFSIHADKIKALDIRVTSLENINSGTSGLISDQAEQEKVAPTQVVESSQFDLESVRFGSVAVDINLDVNGVISAKGGLNVDGLAVFNGESIFNSLSRFLGDSIFSGNVNFEGRVSFNNDSGGFVVIEPGSTEVRVEFEKPYSSTPVISLNVKNGQFVDYVYKDLDQEGFTILLKDSPASNIEFSWTAFEIKDAKTVTKRFEGESADDSRN